MEFLLPLTFLLAPAYIIKLNFFGFPANVLMLWVILLWLIFFAWMLAKDQWSAFWSSITSADKKILLLISLFFLSGIISLFVGKFDRAKLGQFIVLFLQPISLFFIGRYLINKFPSTKNLLLATCYLLLAFAGLYALLQYFTLLGLPSAWWGNSMEPKRAISFFIHPNFYALFTAPLLAFLIPDVGQSLKSKVLSLKTVTWLLAAIGLLLSMSRAGWLGLATAILIYLIFSGNKKIRKLIFSGMIITAIIIALVPNLRWRVILPFRGETSANSRVELWQSGIKAIKTSPIFGLGLNGYAKTYQTFQTDTKLDTHNFPHNIFLDLWVETGLIGLISLMGLMGLLIYRGLKSRELIQLSMALFLLALLVQGQIDNPYFKNDLAMVFWIILSLI